MERSILNTKVLSISTKTAQSAYIEVTMQNGQYSVVMVTGRNTPREWQHKPKYIAHCARWVAGGNKL